MRKLRKVVLWATWVSLMAIWAATLEDLCREGAVTPLLVALFTVMPAWILLYVAEGLELAVAAEGNNPLVPDVHRFFTRRQAVVVVVISYITLVTEYPWIYVPAVGRLTGPFPFLFSFALVTLTTLWFAQIVPKRLAVMDPKRFLSAPWIRPLLVLVDALGAVFDGPSDDIVKFFARDLPARPVGDLDASGVCDCAVCVPLPFMVGAWAEPTGIRCVCAVCRSQTRTPWIDSPVATV